MQVTDKAYQEHPVFAELERYTEFYQKLAMSVFSFATMGTTAICNIDTYVYSSMQGTLESIKSILLSGRINDGYALLRKYYDSAVINAYSNLYLLENYSVESFLVEKINNWLQGRDKLPEYWEMSNYLKKSEVLKPINDVFGVDERYKRLRGRCNDHTHYNFYRYAMLNDNEVYIKDREWWLNQLLEDVRDVFALHLGYVFFIKDHYMMSSDYIDSLECGMQPEEHSQYWVAPFIQQIFDEVITPRRPDITTTIKEKSAMQLL
jgi:hypothetical protein